MLLNLDLEKIVPSKLNPRREIAEAPLAELTDSILRYGVQTPIKVRPIDNDRYEIVYGERRYRASLAAGKPCIPAYIQSMTDEEAEICAVTENMQRADFSPFEEAAISVVTPRKKTGASPVSRRLFPNRKPISANGST